MAAQYQWGGILEQCREIMKSYKLPVMIQSEEALWKKLREGILIDGNKYFMLDSKGRLGVDLYAKALKIAWDWHPEYWTYAKENIPNTDYTVEVAKLGAVCWLEVEGEFDMRKLTLGTEYEIIFDIELIDSAEGWSCPVTFELKSPLGGMTKFEMKLGNLIGKGRIPMAIGKLELRCVHVGNPCATFKMYQHDERWKTGLILRGVYIKPAK